MTINNEIQAKHHHGSNGTMTWNDVWTMADDSQAVVMYDPETHEISWCDGSISQPTDPIEAANEITAMSAE